MNSVHQRVDDACIDIRCLTEAHSDLRREFGQLYDRVRVLERIVDDLMRQHDGDGK